MTIIGTWIEIRCENRCNTNSEGPGLKVGDRCYSHCNAGPIRNCGLNESHRLALKYLISKRPEFISAEEVGRVIGDQLGMDGWGSDFGLPLCKKLVSFGLVLRNGAGLYAAGRKESLAVGEN